MPIRRLYRLLAGGRDLDFGRPFLPGASPTASPPSYGIRLWPTVHYTMGGLAIDPDARVLDGEARPLEGIYAAGELTGGIHGASRLGGCSITDGLVFGRIAGRNAAPSPRP